MSVKHTFTLCLALFTYFQPLSSGEIGESAKICVIMPCAPKREAIVRKLKEAGFKNIVQESCADSKQIQSLFERHHPECVIVDGTDGKQPSRSLLIDMHTIHAVKEYGVKRCFLLSSSAVYPTQTALPFKESALTSLKTDKLQDPYAIAKMVAIKECHAYNDPEDPLFTVCLHPLLYGTKTPICEPIKNPLNEIITRLNEAMDGKRDFVLVSNDGKARYELLHLDDLAMALVFLIQNSLKSEMVNIGTGKDTSIELIAKSLHKGSKYEGELVFDSTQYDEVPRQVLDTTIIQNMGWSPVVELHSSLREMR